MMEKLTSLISLKRDTEYKEEEKEKKKKMKKKKKGNRIRAKY